MRYMFSILPVKIFFVLQSGPLYTESREWKHVTFHFFVNSIPSPRNEVLQESFVKYILPKFVAQCEENVSQFKNFFPIGCFSLILVNFIGIG